MEWISNLTPQNGLISKWFLLFRITKQLLVGGDITVRPTDCEVTKKVKGSMKNWTVLSYNVYSYNVYHSNKKISLSKI